MTFLKISFTTKFKNLQPLSHNRPQNTGKSTFSPITSLLRKFLSPKIKGQMFPYNFRYPKNHLKNAILSIALKYLLDKITGQIPPLPPNDVPGWQHRMSTVFVTCCWSDRRLSQQSLCHLTRTVSAGCPD